jgi:hypothetical protein
MSDTVTTIEATIRYLDDNETLDVVLGVFPEGYDPMTYDEGDLPFDHFIFYWLEQSEAQQFGVGFTTDEWEVIAEGERNETSID